MLIPEGSTLSAFTVVAVGELTVDDFSHSKVGQLLSCVHRVLEVTVKEALDLISLSQAQPFRQEMYSWLAGADQIEFFKTSKKNGGVEHSHWGPFPLSDKVNGGPPFLRSLFLELPAGLGYKPPELRVNGTSHPITGVYGRGASATVYKARLNGQPVAVKAFSRDVLEGMREKETLARCQHPNVVQCLGEASLYCAGEYSYAILLPVVTLFRTSPKDGRALLLHRHLSQLVDAVEAEHKAGLVDRDIRPVNLGLLGLDLVKIDLGFAIEVGRACFYRGTLDFASDRILKHLEEARDDPVTVTPADDLHSVVRTAFALLHPHLVGDLPDSPPLVTGGRLCRAGCGSSSGNSRRPGTTRASGRLSSSSSDCD